uniref:Uncharacterized protein n=1 Tax=Arundo donax TaxID=35708 RepID=A0A0A9H8I3_ARUDO
MLFGLHLAKRHFFSTIGTSIVYLSINRQRGKHVVSDKQNGASIDFNFLFKS